MVKQHLRIIFVVLACPIALAQGSKLQSPVTVNPQQTRDPWQEDWVIGNSCPQQLKSAGHHALLSGCGDGLVISVNGSQPVAWPTPGIQGLPGLAASITVGTTQTGAAGSQAQVTNSGNQSAAILNFVIPQGAKGDTGAQGAVGPTVPIDIALAVHGTPPVANADWTMPPNVTELFNDIVRDQVDLTNATYARVYAAVGRLAGCLGSQIYIEYTENGDKTWTALTAPADVSASGSHVSPWQAVPVLAQADVIVRAVGMNGCGTPIDIKAVHLQVK